MLATELSQLAKLEQLASRDFKKHTARAYRYLGNVHDAEDAVQEALLSAFIHLSDFKSQAKLSTWITSIVINAARAQRRRRKPELSYEQLLESIESTTLHSKLTQDKRPTPENICARNEMFNLVAQMSEQLPPVYRRAIHLCLKQGLNTIAASDTLEIPVSTFKSQLGRARKELQLRIAARRKLSSYSEV